MGNLLAEEISDSKKPLLLVFSNNKKVQNLIYDELSKKLSILFVSSSPPEKEGSDIYHINPSDINLLLQLSEKIDYALIMFSKESEKENIGPVYKKIIEDKAKSAVLIPADDYKTFLDMLLEVRSESNIIPALYGQILEDWASQSEFLKIIRIGLSNGKIVLKGNDLSPVFPISAADFMTSVKQLLFSKKPHGLYYIFYKTPQTILGSIHLLAQIEPDIKFEIDHENPIERYEERSVMSQNLSDKLQLNIHYLDHYLKGFIYAIEHLKTWSTKKTPAAKTANKRSFSFKKPTLLRFSPSVSLALFSAVILFLLINMIFGILGIIFLRSSIHAFEKNDFASAKKNGVLAKNALSVPLPTISVTESALSYLPFMKNAYDTLHLVTSTTELTTITAGLIQKLDAMEQGIEKNDFEKIILDSQYLFHAGSRILLDQENRAITNLLKPQTTKALSLTSIAPTILGYDEPKEYLLLLMNNAELRPTGGFIGSVGRVVVDKGRIAEFEIQDVYDLDGQLTQHIEPHYIVRRNLQPHLYLRDSNFDLDFQRSASLSARIYNIESKNTPDGVVAVDFSLIQKILEITGPIELKDYNQTLTSENSLEFLQDTIEDNFFPGSTQKKDLLNDLFTNIMLKIENNPEHLVSIGLALPELLEDKHILLSYQKEEIQSLLSGLNFAGNIPQEISSEREVIYDTLGFNEANIGVNKVNKDISRSINYKADLTSRLSHAKISIRNSSTTDDYKTYIRLIAPKNSVFRNLLIDGEEVETIEAITDPAIYEADNFKPDKNIFEVETTNDYGKTIFGTLLTVPKGKTMEIEFMYTNPTLFLNDGKDKYDITLIKQPGTNPTPTNIEVIFPKEFSASGEGISSFGNGSIKFETNLRTDTKLQSTFTKE